MPHLWPLLMKDLFLSLAAFPPFSLIQNSAEVHRAQSLQCVIWLLVFNFLGNSEALLQTLDYAWVCYSSCLWHHVLGQGQLLARLPVSFLRHTLLGILMCWLATVSVCLYCLIFDFWVTREHEEGKKTPHKNTFFLKTLDHWIHSIPSISKLHKYFLHVHASE